MKTRAKRLMVGSLLAAALLSIVSAPAPSFAGKDGILIGSLFVNDQRVVDYCVRNYLANPCPPVSR
jgi:hypothetical protein